LIKFLISNKISRFKKIHPLSISPLSKGGEARKKIFPLLKGERHCMKIYCVYILANKKMEPIKTRHCLVSTKEILKNKKLLEQ